MSGITNPHPSPNEEYAESTEYPLPIIHIPGHQETLAHETTIDATRYHAGLEPPVPRRGRSQRVRFRSMSLGRNEQNDSTSHPSDSTSHPSSRPLLSPDPGEGLSGTITPPAPTHSRHGSGLTNMRTPDDDFAEAEKHDFLGSLVHMDRTHLARDRLRSTSHALREKTSRLTERLGRSVDEGEPLNTSFNPDDFDIGIPLEELEARRARHDAGRERSLESGENFIEPPPSAEAHRMVRSMSMVQDQLRKRIPRGAYQRSGQTTPEGLVKDFAERRRSSGVNGGSGILSQLLKLQAAQAGSSSRPESVITDDSDSETQVSSGISTPKKGSFSPPISASMPTSGAATPRKEKLKWYKKSAHRSTSSLINASMNLSTASLPAAVETAPGVQKKRRKNKRKTRLEDEIRVTVHIAEIIARHRYIMQLCRALMRYGAPTHRLEEYMLMTARVLEVSGQFLYLPGCMIMSFDDPTTRTAEVKLVRMKQGVDLGRLADTHNVYKNVVHDLIGVEEATQELDEIMQRKPRFNKWILVLVYGLASATVGPFAFSARPIDMPIIFCLGCIVGLMQHVLAPRSTLYSNVFEVTAAILTSFLARAFGSIMVTRNGKSETLFCFSAMAQSSIALILPGFMVLCSSLELQSHQIIAGSIRMVYAIIYSLFLGYGITVGTTIYGLMDGNATSASTCSGLEVYGSVYLRTFPFVAIYAIFLAIVNHGKLKQMPVMVFIALSGYVANYFSTTKLGTQSEVANTVGAFTIGVLGNLYSRLWHGHAATAILPGIFVLVPSGLASSGSLIAGIQYADEVRENLNSNSTSTASDLSATSVASLGFGMIQVAIGITVGLFMAALVVYPYGKKRTDTNPSSPRQKIIPKMRRIIPADCITSDRGGVVENRHSVHAAITDAAGNLLYAVGDPHRMTLVRSAAKPAQALAILETGAMDRFNFDDADLAFMCASNSSEERHIARARSMLSKVSASEADLRCGGHPPLSETVRRAWIKSDFSPTPICSNCSGKHVGMIAGAKVLGGDVTDYHLSTHPVQIHVKRVVNDVCGLGEDGSVWGLDGCNLPAPAFELHYLARMNARFAAAADATRSGSGTSSRTKALSRVFHAMWQYPELVAGESRFCTILMAAFQGLLIGKLGADGCYGIGIRECEQTRCLGAEGAIGISVKIEDGNIGVLYLAVAEILEQLKIGEPKMRQALSDFHHQVIFNTVNVQTGKFSPCLEVRAV
ncbi:unnamed protein product [Penicillium glandicola]